MTTTTEQYGLLPGEEPLFQFCRNNPDDDFHRGEVYADWLEEHGDPRAELLRLDVWVRENLEQRNQYGWLSEGGDRLNRMNQIAWSIKSHEFFSWNEKVCKVVPRIEFSLASYSVRTLYVKWTVPQEMRLQQVSIDLPITDEMRRMHERIQREVRANYFGMTNK